MYHNVTINQNKLLCSKTNLQFSFHNMTSPVTYAFTHMEGDNLSDMSQAASYIVSKPIMSVAKFYVFGPKIPFKFPQTVPNNGYFISLF